MDTAAKPVAQNVQDRIAQVVGDKGAITDAADMAPYVIDQRKKYEGLTPMVVRPATTAEVRRWPAQANR